MNEINDIRTVLNIKSAIIWWTPAEEPNSPSIPTTTMMVGFSYEIFHHIMTEEDWRMDMIKDVRMDVDYVWASVDVDEDFRLVTKSPHGVEGEYSVETMFKILSSGSRIVDANFSLDVITDITNMKLLRMTIMSAVDKGFTHITMARKMR